MLSRDPYVMYLLAFRCVLHSIDHTNAQTAWSGVTVVTPLVERYA